MVIFSSFFSLNIFVHLLSRGLVWLFHVLLGILAILGWSFINLYLLLVGVLLYVVNLGSRPSGSGPNSLLVHEFLQKVNLILDYLLGSKAQVACSSLGEMKPCSRNHFGTHLECLRLCALAALSVETQVTQHHRQR